MAKRPPGKAAAPSMQAPAPDLIKNKRARKPSPKVKEAVEASQPTQPNIKRAKKPSIPWSKHPEWTDILVSALLDNTKLRQGLFSFSKRDQPGARTSGIRKSDHHEELASLIFKDNPDYETEYKADPLRFGRAVEGRLSRYV
jgi:hypothetical protein